MLFSNFEEFAEEIVHAGSSLDKPVFYSGYDCDSLALEPVSKFIDFFVRWFSAHPQFTLEIRTKSTQVRDLLEMEPVQNCVIAMSFTPQEVYQRWEHRVPSITKRLEALARLQQQGWPVALRFEPLVYLDGFQRDYEQLFSEIFGKLDATALHSVSTGLFRMPKKFYRNIATIYPDEALFARPTEERDGLVSQPQEQEQELLESIEDQLFRYIDKKQYYHCA